MTLAAVLDKERRRQRLSYRRLADQSGEPFESVYRVLSKPKANPSFRAVVGIVGGLGKSLAWLEKAMKQKRRRPPDWRPSPM